MTKGTITGSRDCGCYSYEQAVDTAVTVLKEDGMDAIKLERGAPSRISTAKHTVEAGTAVMGRVGLTPQAISVLGGFRPQEKNFLVLSRRHPGAFSPLTRTNGRICPRRAPQGCSYTPEPVVSALPHSGVEAHMPIQTASMFSNPFTTTSSLVFETPQSLFQNNLDIFSGQTQRPDMTNCPAGSLLTMVEPMPYYTPIPSTGQMIPFPPYSQNFATNNLNPPFSGGNLALPSFNTHPHNHTTPGFGNNHAAGNFPAYMPDLGKRLKSQNWKRSLPRQRHSTPRYSSFTDTRSSYRTGDSYKPYSKGGYGGRYHDDNKGKNEQFTVLTKTPKEILATEEARFSFRPPKPLKGGDKNNGKFCDFHGDVGHHTNDCFQLRKRIEAAVKSGELAHLIKDLKDKKTNSDKHQGEKDKKNKGIMMVSHDSKLPVPNKPRHAWMSQKIKFPPTQNDRSGLTHGN
ncbi:hypothetical protein E3N88_28787 [Mikania micrantha]|uniref:3-methyl-2-oxobutanoate hydroxymethyltransferase n=1 Tax=Mikania micrantha TaxID=192012 RepID=A0A5N6N1G1_9ASTR|nr:hypothetical protein E3N88_28787 [Mikania micrantha]